MDSGWREEDGFLEKIFYFDLYLTGVRFAVKVAEAAEFANHHPNILITYNKVTITTSTFEAGDKVTEKDWSLARESDRLYQEMV